MIRGLIRDLIAIYIGVKLVLTVIMPITTKELVIIGLVTLLFPVWFMLERFGLFNH